MLLLKVICASRLPEILQALRPGRLSGMPNGLPKGSRHKKLNPKVMGTNQFERIEKPSHNNSSLALKQTPVCTQ
jgi:hypothetical protein